MSLQRVFPLILKNRSYANTHCQEKTHGGCHLETQWRAVGALFENKNPTGGNKPVWSVQTQLPGMPQHTRIRAAVCNGWAHPSMFIRHITGHKEAHYRPQRTSLPVLKTVFGTAKCRVSQSRRRHFAHGKAANHTAVGCPMPQRPWPKAPRKAVSRLGTVLFKMTH